ncbi:MAG: TRAP transporter substrate-binding protein DctP [Rhodospirillaceae bacterium]
MTKIAFGVGVAVASAVLAITPASAKDTLTAVTGLERTNVLSESFISQFADKVTQSGAATISYLGGQEVVPPDKAAGALRRGQFDMLHSPSSYYIGTLPEAYALLAGNQGPAAIRKNGGWELLEKIFLEKTGAHLLAWGENMTSYNMYLAKMPPMKDGMPDLTGFKMRATGTYRPLFRALGGSTINIKSSEVYTAMQRGTVDGFGYTDVSIVPLGFHKVAKFRVIPNFYQTNTVVTVNADAWKSLTDQQRAVFNEKAIAYETVAVFFTEKARKEEEAEIKAAGVQDIVLDGEGAAKYVDLAHQEIWKELKNRSDYHDQLKALMYIPGKPNLQVSVEELRAGRRM